MSNQCADRINVFSFGKPLYYQKGAEYLHIILKLDRDWASKGGFQDGIFSKMTSCTNRKNNRIDEVTLVQANYSGLQAFCKINTHFCHFWQFRVLPQFGQISVYVKLDFLTYDLHSHAKILSQRHSLPINSHPTSDRSTRSGLFTYQEWQK